MDNFPIPSDQELEAAYAQGEPAVKALFRRTIDRLQAQIQALEANNSPVNPSGQAAPQSGPRRRAIRQGEVYWLAASSESGEQAHPHPYVVIQDDVFNRSRLRSVVVCALTSNRKKAALPGNILLEAGEANLPKASVVEVSKVTAVDREQFGEHLGSLSEARVRQIIAGMKFLQASARAEDEYAGYQDTIGCDNEIT